MFADDDDFFPGQGDNSPLLQGLFLVASNAVIGVAVYLLLEWGDYATALFYYALGIMSGLYHECRAFNKCLVPYGEHQKLDYIFVHLALIWTITAIGAEHPVHYKKRLIVFIVFFAITILLILGDNDAWLLAVVAGGGPGLTMIAIAVHHHQRLFKVWQMAVIGFVLAGIGGVFMYLFPYSTYGWSHGLWHVFVMLALLAFVFSVYGFKPLTPLLTPPHVTKVYRVRGDNPRSSSTPPPQPIAMPVR